MALRVLLPRAPASVREADRRVKKKKKKKKKHSLQDRGCRHQNHERGVATGRPFLPKPKSINVYRRKKGKRKGRRRMVFGDSRLGAARELEE
jgi:hypothetical protein